MSKEALFFKGDYYGTLAAIRSLGSRGISVTLAEPSAVATGSLSRYLHARVTPPAFEETEAFLAWMDDFGQAHSGCFLYPVSDVSCWLFAVHGDRLRKNFRLPYPGMEVIRKILYKPELNRIAKSVGIACPETWTPTSENDVLEIAKGPDMEGYVIKPKTQLGQRILSKGSVIESGKDLLSQWKKFNRSFPSDPVPGLIEGKDVAPLIQRYVASAANGVFSVAGYINQDGSIFKTLGAVKILQRPARMGIGLCFESYAIRPDLHEKVKRLCLDLGYYGLFEVEFLITDSNEEMILDFNCRYYGQIGFDIKRGFDTIQLVYSDGREGSATKEQTAPHYRYALGWYLILLMVTNFVQLRWKFVAEWSRWLFFGRGQFIDKVWMTEDPGPFFGDMLSQFMQWIRHPRSSFKTLFDLY